MTGASARLVDDAGQYRAMSIVDLIGLASDLDGPDDMTADEGPELLPTVALSMVTGQARAKLERELAVLTPLVRDGGAVSLTEQAEAAKALGCRPGRCVGA